MDYKRKKCGEERMREHVIYTNKFATDIDAFEFVATNQRLSEDALRLFMALCCRIGSKHCIKIDKKRLRENLCLCKKDFEKALDNLEDEGIIAVTSDNYIKNGCIMTYISTYYNDYDD